MNKRLRCGLFISIISTLLTISGCASVNQKQTDKSDNNNDSGVNKISSDILKIISAGKEKLKNISTVGTINPDYMNQHEAVLRQKLESTDVQIYRNGNEIKLVIPGNVTFNSGKTVIKKEFHGTLHSIGNVISNFEKTRVEVSGFTDSSGSDEFNQFLSEKRAESVANFLIQRRVKTHRIITKGYGEQNPIADNSTSYGRSLNRRVELKIRTI